MSKEDINNDGTIPCILYGELYTTYLNKIENIVSRIKLRTNIIVANKGDVILPLSGETPLDISNSAVIPFDGVALGGDLIALRTSLNPLFLSYQLSGKRKLQIARLAQGKSVVHSNPNQLMKLLIFYPSKKEQDKIAQTVFCISKKIELIGRKVEALKKYKEGLILKALKPSIENWKTSSVNGIRLSSFLVPYKKLASTDNYIHATLSKEGISDKTERYNRDFLVKDENKKYRITDEGDLIYNPANLKFGVICINHYGKCVVSPIYETFKVRNIDRDLLESIVTSKSFIRYALKFEEGTVYERRAVSVADLLNIKICVDDNNLDNISNILKIIQRKIDKLNYAKEQLCKIKSYLLNAMFI